MPLQNVYCQSYLLNHYLFKVRPSRALQQLVRVQLKLVNYGIKLQLNHDMYTPCPTHNDCCRIQLAVDEWNAEARLLCFGNCIECKFTFDLNLKVPHLVLPIQTFPNGRGSSLARIKTVRTGHRRTTASQRHRKKSLQVASTLISLTKDDLLAPGLHRPA